MQRRGDRGPGPAAHRPGPLHAQPASRSRAAGGGARARAGRAGPRGCTGRAGLRRSGDPMTPAELAAYAEELEHLVALLTRCIARYRAKVAQAELAKSDEGAAAAHAENDALQRKAKEQGSAGH